MKIGNFNIRHFLLLLLVSAGLLYITRSFLMSLGILLLIILADQLIAQYEQKKKRENRNKEQKNETEE